MRCMLMIVAGSMLVSGAYDQTVVVWDAENCGPKLTLKVKPAKSHQSHKKQYFFKDSDAYPPGNCRP